MMYLTSSKFPDLDAKCNIVSLKKSFNIINMKELIKKITNQKFESVINGYSPVNVDIFLDSIINDLEEIQNKFNEIKKQNEELKNKIKILEEANISITTKNSTNEKKEIITNIEKDSINPKKDEI